jgi:hypothetical protein
MSNKSLLPCKTCPWRVDMDATTIPGYDHEKAKNLMNTVGEGDAFRPIMACHHSTDDNVYACKGYLAREGWSNINVRLLLSKGKIVNPSEAEDACNLHGVELEPDHPTVLTKLATSKRKDL